MSMKIRFPEACLSIPALLMATLPMLHNVPCFISLPELTPLAIEAALTTIREAFNQCIRALLYNRMLLMLMN